MPDLGFLSDWMVHLPSDMFADGFMRRAFLALLLLSPTLAMMGVHVVNLRLAFYADAVSHSVFAGLAAAVLLQAWPGWGLLGIGVLVAVAAVFLQRRAGLSTDTGIGVLFSASVAAGLMAISQQPQAARLIQQYVLGDILTVGDSEILLLAGLLAMSVAGQFVMPNSLVHLAFSETLSAVHHRHSGILHYAAVVMLSVVVVAGVSLVGVLLITSLLVVPAATARNLAQTYRGAFWWTQGLTLAAVLLGLTLAAQDWVSTPPGATIVALSCVGFAASLVAKWAIARSRRACSVAPRP